MTCATRVFCVGTILLLYVCSLSSATWFSTGPRALAGLASSASASASSPSTSVSYIADLRRKEAKSAQLQEENDEKEIVGLEPLPESNEDDGNEASPSLLQKKIGKILAKLRLIAQIKNAYHYRPEDHEHEPEQEINFNITSVKHENETEKKEIDEVQRRIVNTNPQSENIQQIPHVPIVFPKEEIIVNPVVVLSPEPVNHQPVKIDLDVNNINDKLEDFKITKTDKLREQEPSRLGAFGVFLAEVVGSIVGLTYGAVAQITSAGQSPVTVSTSEGL